MSANSSIAWTHHTYNPVIGCTRVSPGCDHCYAADWSKVYAQDVAWGEPGQRSVLRRTAESTLKAPFKWNRSCQQRGVRERVFCASLSDWADKDWLPEWRLQLCETIEATPNLDYLLLTKRPQNVMGMVPKWWRERFPSNVWVGTTVENQAEADRRIPHLLEIPARIRFLSCEPLLGPLNLRKVRPDMTMTLDALTGEAEHLLGDRAIAPRHVDWVIIGGESGRNFRPMAMDWVADLRVQCRDTNVPVFFKQDSSKKPGCKGRASDALWNTKQFPVAA